MELSDEQLVAIKVKIETEKIRPAQAIKALYPEGDLQKIREQLFAKYDKKELRSHAKTVKTARAKKSTKDSKSRKVRRANKSDKDSK